MMQSTLYSSRRWRREELISNTFKKSTFLRLCSYRIYVICYVQIIEMIDNFWSGSLNCFCCLDKLQKKLIYTSYKKINLLGISKLNQQCWWQLWGLNIFHLKEFTIVTPGCLPSQSLSSSAILLWVSLPTHMHKMYSGLKCGKNSAKLVMVNFNFWF